LFGDSCDQVVLRSEKLSGFPGQRTFLLHNMTNEEANTKIADSLRITARMLGAAKDKDIAAAAGRWEAQLTNEVATARRITPLEIIAETERREHELAREIAAMRHA
jgi:hypothetical protein